MRRPMVVSRVKISNAWPVVKMTILIACVSVGVLLMIFFGFPLIEDLVKGVDPALRYQSKAEADFAEAVQQEQDTSLQMEEMYLADYTLKNDPYIAGDQIIFTTRQEKKNIVQLDAVAIYDTLTKDVRILPNVEKKYDNLLQPMMAGNIAVWVDSMTGGGGRIVGYDLSAGKQFVIKEYAYAMPELSLCGELLAFMQWAGDATQRLYVYNVKTREAVTVKLYENTATGNSAVDLSATDLVWSEYAENNGQVSGTLKRIVWKDGAAKYENYEMKTNVFEPKTNGKDIVFATEKDILSGSLMLSTGGGEPVRIADHVLNYELGDGFVAYTKDEKVSICFTTEQNAYQLTSDITKSLLASVNQNAITYYDITDGVLTDEVVMYAHVN